MPTATTVDRRRRGWALAILGMLGVSLDSPFVRAADTDGWTMSFWVGLGAIVAFGVLRRLLGGDTVRATLHRRPALTIGSAALAALTQIGFVTAITETAVANVVAVVAAMPVLAAGWSRLLAGERTRPRVWWAMVGVAVGIAVIVAPSLGTPTLRGDLLAVVAVGSFALNTAIWRANPDLETLVVFQLAAAMVVAVSLVVGDPLPGEARIWAAAAGMGLVANPLGRFFFARALRYAPAAEVGLFAPVETIAAPVWVWLAFGERPPGRALVGGAIIVAAVLFGTVGGGYWSKRAS